MDGMCPSNLLCICLGYPKVTHLALLHKGPQLLPRVLQDRDGVGDQPVRLDHPRAGVCKDEQHCIICVPDLYGD